MVTRVGIIGTGFAAGAHAEALRRLPGVRLLAVASRDRDRAATFARRYGAERDSADYGALIADPEVDAVHICAVNDAHVELSAAALAAGKHVLCEKPLGVDARETARAARLADEAAARGLVAAVCFNYRFFPLVHEIRARLASGDAGPVHLVHGTYLQDWLLERDDWNWRVDARVGGGLRAVADIGSHWCDLAQFMTGDRVVSVLADFGVVHPTRRFDGAEAAVSTEDFAGLMLRFESGARGVVVLSQVSAGHKNGLTIEVDAHAASFAWDQEAPDRAWIGTRDHGNVELLRDPSMLRPEAAGLAHYPAGHAEGWPDALRNLLEDFYRSVAAAGSAEPHISACATFADAHRLVQLGEAAARSQRLGRWVDVGVGEPVAA